MSFSVLDSMLYLCMGRVTSDPRIFVSADPIV